jgi:hypothetical protein
MGNPRITMKRSQKQSPATAESEPPARRGRAAAIGMDAAMLGRAAFGRAGFDDPVLVLRWHEIAGPEVARIARPSRISEGPSGGVLTLRADPAAAVFLQHESRALCDRINAWLGRAAVLRLRFVPGDIAADRAGSSRNCPQESAPGDPARRFTGPDRLKDALLALAGTRRHV